MHNALVKHTISGQIVYYVGIVTGNPHLGSPITWCFLWLVPIGVGLVMDRKKGDYRYDNFH